jgi:hypothetical protein
MEILDRRPRINGTFNKPQYIFDDPVIFLLRGWPFLGPNITALLTVLKYVVGVNPVLYWQSGCKRECPVQPHCKSVEQLHMIIVISYHVQYR